MGEWISVEDRLPELQIKAHHDGFAFVIASSMLGVGEHIYSKRLGWQKFGMPDVVDIMVTHWMPMPEPPVNTEPQ